jgi:catechol 2,3-dioxygenase-like lactoylglutathione lyase family enzyme
LYVADVLPAADFYTKKLGFNLGLPAIEVAPLMLGGNVFGWTVDQPTSFKILDAFVDAELDFIRAFAADFSLISAD